MSLHVDADKGLVLLSVSPYDETIVDAIRALRERRYRPAEQDWVVPARRDHLRTLCGVIAELSERRVDVRISDAAAARLARGDVGWAMLRDGEIQIAGPYSERRLPALRALAERRFDPEGKVWVLPLTRAGALGVLALADDAGDLVITARARRALHRSAAPTEGAPHVERDEDRPPGPARRSPVAHWRHFTSGPVFENPARPRVHVPGVGLCVRIRVNPRAAASAPRRRDRDGR